MRKVFVVIGLVLSSLAIVIMWQYFRFNDGKMHVIFCNVGQGDAILIKTPNNKYLLYDGGPDRSVLHCLAQHMPFWQRRIDLLILSHPHADHFFGMFYILDLYDVNAFVTEDLINKTQASDELTKLLGQKHIPQKIIGAGDGLRIGQVSLLAVGPTKAYLQQTSPGGTIGESREFASLVLHLVYGSFGVLLTGDSQAIGLEDARAQIEHAVTVLQVPHHGSETGLDADALGFLQPNLAVISVGADNTYKHPNPKTLDLLKSLSIPFLRTDKNGDIEIVSDGAHWKRVL